MNESAPGLARKSPSHRAQTRIVKKPFLGQNLKRPQMLSTQENVGSAIAEDLMAARFLNGRAPAPNQLAELGPSHGAEARPAISGQSDLVTLAHHFPQHIRALLSEPRADKKCCPGFRVGQQ